jgi:multidrug transporter EmrE-like cation transporter
MRLDGLCIIPFKEITALRVYLIYVMLSIIFNIAANFTLKAFAAQRQLTFFELLQNAPLYIAIVFFGINFLFYTKAMQSMNLSVIYPIVVGLSAISIVLLSRFFLNEKLEIVQYVGICLVVLGIIFIYIRS